MEVEIFIYITVSLLGFAIGFTVGALAVSWCDEICQLEEQVKINELKQQLNNDTGRLFK